MKPLHGQALSVFQEEMKHIQYIVIDEMSFIGPKLFVQIESRLHECCPETNKHSFDNQSIILVGDLGQLPPVMERPIYAGETLGKCLWTYFTTIIILEIVFRQMGTDVTQLCFCQLLTNIHNATPTMEDWTLLHSRTNKFLSIEERSQFDTAIHLFATNMLANNQYKYMLQLLAMPITRSVADFTTGACITINSKKKYYHLSENESCYPTISGSKKD